MEPKENDAPQGERNLETSTEENSHSSAGPINSGKSTDWFIFKGTQKRDDSPPTFELPPPPPWRDFERNRKYKGSTLRVSEKQIQLVNAALYLRRPLLITGLPGTGKSSLAYAVASELGLGEVLKWSITSRSLLKDGLYSYDAIGRLQSSNLNNTGENAGQRTPPIGQFIRLGPLGTAFAESAKNNPRVLLIDEIDKSDIDLPNDLLNIFEDGEFEIPELARLAQDEEEQEQTRISIRLDRPRDNQAADRIEIEGGKVVCKEFPFVILTSNGERELPAPFLRRCLRLEIAPPDEVELQRIVKAHFSELGVADSLPTTVIEFINNVVDRRRTKQEYVATDQLLNAVYLILNEKVDKSLREDPQMKKLLQEYILETIGSTWV